MIEIEQKLGVANQNWLMSAREKLGLIGLLQCLNPESVIELGYHRGGATKWLSKYSKKVLIFSNIFISPKNTKKFLYFTVLIRASSSVFMVYLAYIVCFEA